MRVFSWMLLVLLAFGLASCKKKEPDLPEGTNAEKPKVETGELDPDTVSTTGEESTDTNNPESEAPPFNPGGGDDSDADADTDSDTDSDADAGPTDAGPSDPPSGDE